MWKNRNWRKQINGGKILDEYQNRAAVYVENPTLLNRFLNRVQKYLGDTITRRVSGVAMLIKDVPLLVRLVRAWMKGSYQSISKKNILIVIAGLLYFLSPFDLIPDFLGAFGFIDDVAILGLVLSRLQEEIAAFRDWEASF